MYEEQPRSSRNWPAAIIILAVLGFVCLAVWWMSENFGASFAMAVVGILLGAALISLGVMLNQKNTQTTLGEAADFNRSLALSESARQATYKESARLERDAFNARARMQVIDERRVDQLAQQRARLLTMNNQAPPPRQNAWLQDDDADGEPVDARWYE